MQSLMPSANWRTRKARSIIQPESGSPRTRSSDVEGQENMAIPGQEKKE